MQFSRVTLLNRGCKKINAWSYPEAGYDENMQALIENGSPNLI